MEKKEIGCNVLVHTRSYIGDEALRGSRQLFNLQAIEDYKAHCIKNGIDILYIEDIEMRPFVRRFIEVMKGLGVSFVNNKGVYYYYMEGKPYMYPDATRSFEGRRLEELDIRIAVQNHINSLIGNEREEELSYIEGKHNQMTGESIPLGQMSIYDYIEGGEYGA